MKQRILLLIFKKMKSIILLRNKLGQGYSHDPMICPHCGGEMKIIAVIQDTKEIKKIGFYMLPRQFFFVYPPQHLRSGITFPIIRLSGFYMLPRQFFFVYPPQHLRSGITFPIIRYNFSYH
jgi:hypothetical protein